MPQITLTYNLDLGALGQREVRVEAQVLKSITGQLYIDIERVLINVHGTDADLAPFIRPRDMQAMAEALKHQYWSEAFRGLEAVGETAL